MFWLLMENNEPVLVLPSTSLGTDRAAPFRVTVANVLHPLDVALSD